MPALISLVDAAAHLPGSPTGPADISATVCALSAHHLASAAQAGAAVTASDVRVLAALIVLTVATTAALALTWAPAFMSSYIAGLSASIPRRYDCSPTTLRRDALLSTTALSAALLFTLVVTAPAGQADAQPTSLWLTQAHLTALCLPTAAVLAWAALVDLRVHRLPQRMMAAAGVLLLPAIGLVWTSAGSTGALRACAWAVGLGAGGYLLSLIPHGLGRGDAKMLVVIGAWMGCCGTFAAVHALLLALLISGMAALVLVMTGRARARTALPLGPALSLASSAIWLTQLTAL